MELRVRALETVLAQKGYIDPAADALSREISGAQARGDADLGDTYYQHWLRALETLVALKGAASADELARCGRAWAEAAERTPHGSAIEF
jgi:hypothetical protein